MCDQACTGTSEYELGSVGSLGSVARLSARAWDPRAVPSLPSPHSERRPPITGLPLM